MKKLNFIAQMIAITLGVMFIYRRNAYEEYLIGLFIVVAIQVVLFLAIDTFRKRRGDLERS